MSTGKASKEPFVAIDFETANMQRSSACSVGLVRVEAGKIVGTEHYLIRPPSKHFRFTDTHGITWEHVEDAGTFRDVWREVKYLVKGARYFVAHNAAFDRDVLRDTMEWHDMRVSALPFACTRRLAATHWQLRPAKLPDVCKHLSVPLARHHDALEDATAAARIALRGLSEGWVPSFLS